MITEGQSTGLRRAIMRYARNKSQGLWILGKLIGRKAKSFDDVSEEEWNTIRSRVQRALSLETAEAWSKEMFRLKDRHEVEALGQMELF